MEGEVCQKCIEAPPNVLYRSRLTLIPFLSFSVHGTPHPVEAEVGPDGHHGVRLPRSLAGGLVRRKRRRRRRRRRSGAPLRAGGTHGVLEEARGEASHPVRHGDRVLGVPSERLGLRVVGVDRAAGLRVQPADGGRDRQLDGHLSTARQDDQQSNGKLDIVCEIHTQGREHPQVELQRVVDKIEDLFVSDQQRQSPRPAQQPSSEGFHGASSPDKDNNPRGSTPTGVFDASALCVT